MDVRVVDGGVCRRRPDFGLQARNSNNAICSATTGVFCLFGKIFDQVDIDGIVRPPETQAIARQHADAQMQYAMMQCAPCGLCLPKCLRPLAWLDGHKWAILW